MVRGVRRSGSDGRARTGSRYAGRKVARYCPPRRSRSGSLHRDASREASRLCQFARLRLEVIIFTWIFGSKPGQWRARTASPCKLLVASRAPTALLVAMISAAGLVHPPVRAALPPLNSTETAGATAPASRKHTIRPRLSEAYGKLPVSFEANTGQADSHVKSIARGNTMNPLSGTRSGSVDVLYLAGRVMPF
jgi:hypothetical protein